MCAYSWMKLLKSLGKTEADDEPIRFSWIAASNGVNDALWCLCVLGKKHAGRVHALICDFAEHVLPIFEKIYPDDKRPRVAIETARRYAAGQATVEELWIAAAAACHAASDAYAAAAADNFSYPDAYAVYAAADAIAGAAYAIRAAYAAHADHTERAAKAVYNVAARTAHAAHAVYDIYPRGARATPYVGTDDTAERQWQLARLVDVFG